MPDSLANGAAEGRGTEGTGESRLTSANYNIENAGRVEKDPLGVSLLACKYSSDALLNGFQLETLR